MPDNLVGISAIPPKILKNVNDNKNKYHTFQKIGKKVVQKNVCQDFNEATMS